MFVFSIKKSPNFTPIPWRQQKKNRNKISCKRFYRICWQCTFISRCVSPLIHIMDNVSIQSVCLSYECSRNILAQWCTFFVFHLRCLFLLSMFVHFLRSLVLFWLVCYKSWNASNREREREVENEKEKEKNGPFKISDWCEIYFYLKSIRTALPKLYLAGNVNMWMRKSTYSVHCDCYSLTTSDLVNGYYYAFETMEDRCARIEY